MHQPLEKVKYTGGKLMTDLQMIYFVIVCLNHWPYLRLCHCFLIYLPLMFNTFFYVMLCI
jgi:hypothetical protein